MIKRKTPPIVKVSIDGRCAKLNKTDGTSTAMYLFHLLSSSLIMKPRNSISSNIPAFKAIRIDEIIIKNLGKQINRFIFEESGVLIGNALKSARNKEALFGGVLGIRHFCKDDAQYYYSGYLGKSITGHSLMLVESERFAQLVKHCNSKDTSLCSR